MNDIKTFKFEKESNGKWYVVLPEWEGDKEELEMVCGADTFLDILSQGESEVSLDISLTKPSEFMYELIFKEESGGGGWYELKSDMFNFDIWLCHVTKFVFGYLPVKIYI